MNRTPPDWALIEAAKRSGRVGFSTEYLRYHYLASDSDAFRPLCDMIERYEQPPVDRKLLCAREACNRAGLIPEGQVKEVAFLALELWEEGFGK